MDRCLLEVVRNVKRGLEVRTYSWLPREMNDASIIYFQDFLCWIIWTHLLRTRPEPTAICIWLFVGHLEEAAPGRSKMEGISEEVFAGRIAVACVLFRASSWSLNWSLQQKSSEFNQHDANSVYLYLPLILSEKMEMWSAQCLHLWQDSMFTNQLLKYWFSICLGAWLWRNH